jgi:transcriptional regulator with XRE-family HTH domain
MAPKGTPEMQAEALVMIADGLSMSEIARRLSVSPATIKNWRMANQDIVPLAVYDPHAAQKEKIRKLLLDLVVTKLESLIEMTKFTADKGWLRTQTAADVGSLMNTSDNKLFRLLEKFENARNESTTPED